MPYRLPENIEELIPEDRIDRAEPIVRRRVRDLPEDAQLVAWMEPAGTVVRDGEETPVPARAVFAVISPDPRRPGFNLATMGASWFSDWADEDRRYRQGAVVIDPVVTLFTIVAAEHASKVANLRSLLN